MVGEHRLFCTCTILVISVLVVVVVVVVVSRALATRILCSAVLDLHAAKRNAVLCPKIEN